MASTKPHRAEAPLVGLVRRLHGRAREREDSRRGRQRCRAHIEVPRPRAGVEVGALPASFKRAVEALDHGFLEES